MIEAKNLLRALKLSFGFGFVALVCANLPAEAQNPMPPTVNPAPQTPETPPVKTEVLRARGSLKNTFSKLEKGEPVTIAYFGGSITAGSGASSPDKCYRALVTNWFREKYPKSQITEVNAAIGGTGSNLGVFRFGQDVLIHHPDLVFVEFAVNDGGESPAQILPAMEGILRQVWHADANTDVCLIYTYQENQQADLERGFFPRAASVHDFLGEKYDVPAIGVSVPIANLIHEGHMVTHARADVPEGVSVFSADGVHPKDEAMAIYAKTITDSMATLAATGNAGPHVLPPAVMSNNQEHGRLEALQPAMLSPGWKELSADEGLGKKFHQFLPHIWQGSAGDTLTFQFKGPTAKIFDIVGPAGGQIWVTVDGVKGQQPLPRFDSYSTYDRLQSLTLAENLPDTTHTVRIEIDANQPDRTPAMKSEKDPEHIDPNKYNGTFVRIGWLMLDGELVAQ